MTGRDREDGGLRRLASWCGLAAALGGVAAGLALRFGAWDDGDWRLGRFTVTLWSLGSLLAFACAAVGLSHARSRALALVDLTLALAARALLL